MRFLDQPPEDPGWGHARGPGTEGVRLHYVRRGSGEAALFASYPGGLERVAVDDPGTGLWVPLQPHPNARLRRAECILSQVPSKRQKRK